MSIFYSILSLMLRFTKKEAEVREQALSFVPARYIRTFDVISGVIDVLLRRKRSSIVSQLRAENIPVHSGRFVSKPVVQKLLCL